MTGVSFSDLSFFKLEGVKRYLCVCDFGNFLNVHKGFPVLHQNFQVCLPALFFVSEQDQILVPLGAMRRQQRAERDDTDSCCLVEAFSRQSVRDFIYFFLKP